MTGRSDLRKLRNNMIGGCLFVAVFGTLAHFIYEWSGYSVWAGLFTPVSESTWEHMKLLFFPMLLFGIFSYCKLHREFPSILYAFPIGILLGELLIPVLFYTYTGIVGRHYLIPDVLTFYISVILAFLTVYLLGKKNRERILPSKYKIIGIVSSLFTLTLALCFWYFTFNPPSIGLFL